MWSLLLIKQLTPLALHLSAEVQWYSEKRQRLFFALCPMGVSIELFKQNEACVVFAHVMTG